MAALVSARKMFVSSDLKARFLTALILGPIVLVALVWGGIPFALILGLVAGLHNWEWNTVFHRGPDWLIYISPALVVATTLSFAFAGIDAAIICGAIGFFICLFSNRLLKPVAAAGFLYSTLWALCAIGFRHSETYGLIAVLFITFLVWGFDIAGYFFGKAIGGPKLLPAISPKKTWAGFLGGLATAGFVCLGLGLYYPEINPLAIVLVGLAIALAAQVGDLFESAVKRYVNVKDSSHLLPGHGGMMDRIDGLIAAVLVGWIIAYLNPNELSLARSLFFF